MTDAYILVKVPEEHVALVRTAIHANYKHSTDIVFYENGQQAQFYGDDIPQYAEQRRYIELDQIMRSHVESALAERDRRYRVIGISETDD